MEALSLGCFVIRLTDSPYHTYQVSPAAFDADLEQFGAQYLVELTSVMGHYAQTAFILNAFAVDLPAGTAEPVLPV